MKNVRTIKQLDEASMTAVVDQIANDILKVSAGVNAMRAGKLSDRALVVLLQDCTGQTKATINSVLNGLADLEKVYIKKVTK